MLPFCLPQLSLFVKRSSQSAKAQDIKKSSQKSKHGKNCAGFVALLQWTSNSFQKKQTQKTGNNDYIAKQNQNALLAATSLTCSNVAKHFKIMIHGHWLICNLFSSPGCHVCRMIFLTGVISHPRNSWRYETSGNLQQLVWSHGETAVLVVSCKAVGFPQRCSKQPGTTNIAFPNCKQDGKSNTDKVQEKLQNRTTRRVQKLGLFPL